MAAKLGVLQTLGRPSSGRRCCGIDRLLPPHQNNVYVVECIYGLATRAVGMHHGSNLSVPAASLPPTCRRPHASMPRTTRPAPCAYIWAGCGMRRGTPRRHQDVASAATRLDEHLDAGAATTLVSTVPVASGGAMHDASETHRLPLLSTRVMNSLGDGGSGSNAARALLTPRRPR